ncbi:response regulator transcription factor [Clostridium oceanicum]|uniref:Stage 0 sporulation protein A homolog n=1 Tax=Clostridium oceanicum TaxID=1543 RepID=A0ABN1JQR8_9CLOT
MKENILVVDDEKEIVELIEVYLRNNYNVFKCFNGEEALDTMKNNKIDLAIVDIMMPKIDGYNLINEIRKESNIPIIIVSAKVQGHEKVIGLHTGADDYVTKPFDPLELLARVNAQLRRYYKFNDNNQEEEIKKIINIGDLSLNKEDFTVKKNGETVSLTSTEYKILELFMDNPNKVFTKKNIFESVWAEPYFHEDNAIMVHISKLRDKVEDDSKNPRYIKTIRGLGYKLKDDTNEK